MRKYIIVAFLLIFAVSLFGSPFLSMAANEVSFTENTTVTLGNGISVTILANSLCDQMVVGTSTLQFILSANSGVSIRSSERRMFSVDIGLTTNCGDPNYSFLNLPSQTTATTVTVTPSASSTCSSASQGGGSGGGTTTTPTTPTKPTTTTGEVTVTASGGGKTTLTSAENTTASVDFPVNAVSSSTDVTIAFETKASVIAAKPLPSGKSVIGSYVFNFTASSGGQAVVNFSEHATLDFTYTDSQITDLNEDTLKIYYWDSTQWLGIDSTVNKTTNTVTATTNHFTYFVVLGESVTPSQMAKPEDYGLKEGDLIRAQGDFDIFIVNQYGYKRLFLNPAIFNMYGHLGGWNKVKTVTKATRDAFVTSQYYRYVDSPKVYKLEVTGEDTGILYWLNMTAENFLAQGGKADAVFTINKQELDWYSKGADKTSL